jgi:hypothetical protein
MIGTEPTSGPQETPQTTTRTLQRSAETLILCGNAKSEQPHSHRTFPFTLGTGALARFVSTSAVL